MGHILLAVSDSDPTPTDLTDGVNFSASFDTAGPSINRATAGNSIALHIRILGNVTQNWNLLQRKFQTDAAAASGPNGLAQSNLVLILQLRREATRSYVDILPSPGGVPIIYRTGFGDYAVTLNCLPYARGAPVTYSGLVVPTGGGSVWLSDVPGTVPGPARIVATDNSTGGKRIVRLAAGQHAGSQLVDADSTPLIAAVPQTPGAAHGNGAAYGGTEAQLATVNTTWQSLARFALPSTGRMNRRGRVYARVRSAAAVIGQPGNFTAVPSAGAGSIGTAEIAACVVPYDGTAPYVSGVNHLGAASALITRSTQLLVQGGGTPTALTPQLHDGFEDGTTGAYMPGLFQTLNGGSASGTISSSTPHTGTNKFILTATSPAVSGTATVQALRQTVGPLTANKVESWRVWVNVQAYPATAGGTGKTALPLVYVLYDSGANHEIFGLWAAFGASPAWCGAFHALSSADLVPVNSPTLVTPTQTLGAGWHEIEITASLDGADANLLTLRLAVDGVIWGGTTRDALTTAPLLHEFGVVVSPAGTAAPAAQTMTVWVDDIDMADGYLGGGATVSGYAYIYDWDAAANAGGYLLKYNWGGVWCSVDVGAPSTYTLASLIPTGVTINSPPPTATPPIQPSLLRLAAGAVGASPSQFGRPIELTGSSRYEWADGGPLSLPPVPTRWGQAALPAYIEAQVTNGGGADTVAVDSVIYVDELRSKVTVEALALAAAGKWDIDTRPDGLPTGVITDAGSGAVTGVPSITGPLRLGPGGVELVIIPSVADGAGGAVADAVNAKCTVDITIVPLNDLSSGV